MVGLVHDRSTTPRGAGGIAGDGASSLTTPPFDSPIDTTCFSFEQKDKDGLKSDLEAAGLAAKGMREEAQQKEHELLQVFVCFGLCVCASIQ